MEEWYVHQDSTRACAHTYTPIHVCPHTSKHVRTCTKIGKIKINKIIAYRVHLFLLYHYVIVVSQVLSITYLAIPVACLFSQLLPEANSQHLL